MAKCMSQVEVQNKCYLCRDEVGQAGAARYGCLLAYTLVLAFLENFRG